MNSLSWLLYFADIAGSLDGALSFFGFVGLIIGLAAFVGGSVPWTRYSFQSDKDWEGISSIRDTIRKVGGRAFLAAALAVTVSGLIPSSKTIYMIAASEAGEAVVTSPDTIEMMGDLKAIIKKRLKEELGE